MLRDTREGGVDIRIRVREISHREAPLEQGIPAIADLSGRLARAHLREVGVQYGMPADFVSSVIEAMQLREGHVARIVPDETGDDIERSVQSVLLQHRKCIRVLVLISVVKGQRHHCLSGGGMCRRCKRPEHASYYEQGGNHGG
jgi:hypothetical protein